MSYQQLVSDCKEIIVEYEFTSRWALVEGYHLLGKRINQEKSVTVTKLANDLNKSERTIRRSIQFYKKYPDLSLLPEGKNTSWHQIVNKYLPELAGKNKEPILIECPQCHYKWEK